MLTADLIVARSRRGRLEPRWIDPEDDGLLARAELILSLFRTGVGQTRAELREQFDEGVGHSSTEIKLDRGLYKLCVDRSDFGVEAGLDPVELRDEVFSRAVAWRAEHGGGVDRGAIMGELAARHGVTVAELDEWLYADLRDNERLNSFRDLTASALLHRYNMALAQSVLLKAKSIEVFVRLPTARHVRRLFGALKFHRLLHTVKGTLEEGYELRIDGPTSLFSLSQQYGMRMANFLPVLALSPHWELKAGLEWGPKRTRRRFEVNHELGLKSHARDVGTWLPEELKRFPESWPEDADWRLETDTEVHDLGGRGVLIPDFVFRHRNGKTRVVMEVLGYWNKGSVERRRKLLKRHGPKNLILAVSKELFVDDADLKALEAELDGRIYPFRSMPLVRPLLKILEGFAPKSRKRGAKTAKGKAGARETNTAKTSAAKTNTAKSKSKTKSARTKASRTAGGETGTAGGATGAAESERS